MTEIYLSFASYKKIKEENGIDIKFNFAECMNYFQFCFEHNFLYYGYYSKQPLEVIYYQLKQMYKK